MQRGLWCGVSIDRPDEERFKTSREGEMGIEWLPFFKVKKEIPVH